MEVNIKLQLGSSRQSVIGAGVELNQRPNKPEEETGESMKTQDRNFSSHWAKSVKLNRQTINPLRAGLLPVRSLPTKNYITTKDDFPEESGAISSQLLKTEKNKIKPCQYVSMF